MSKKFDVVIGNPPYQDDRVGDSTSASPIYPKFMDVAYEVGEKVVLITPARFLFNAGYTSKIWNQKMLDDPHLSVPIYVEKSDELFPGTDIKGGVAVTYRDSSEKLGPIRAFSRNVELNSVLKKVANTGESLGPLVTKRDGYKYTELMHQENPEASALMSKSAQFIVNTDAFEKLPFLFHNEQPDDQNSYVQMLSSQQGKREFKWVRSDFITGPTNFSKYKVAIAAANGSGTFGEALAPPVVLEPDVAVTQTFLTIGAFDSDFEAQACLLYIKTKFARAMLGVLKVTQHNTGRVWEHVPLQDFTQNSDIDWTKSISDIDQQLYAKYRLDAQEVEFIEANVKSMD